MSQNATEGPSGVTLDQVKTLMQEMLTPLAEQVRAAGNAQPDAKKALARQLYIAEKMKDLPPVYQDRMPVTDDPAALAAEEEKIRQLFRADFKTHGEKAPEASGGGASTASPLELSDPAKVSPTERLTTALQRERASRGE